MSPLTVSTLEMGIVKMFGLIWAGIQARAWKYSLPETTLVWTAWTTTLFLREYRGWLNIFHWLFGCRINFFLWVLIKNKSGLHIFEEYCRIAWATVEYGTWVRAVQMQDASESVWRDCSERFGINLDLTGLSSIWFHFPLSNAVLNRD